MKIIEHLAHAKQPRFSIEIMPPLKGESMRTIINKLEPVAALGPLFINVTYHREEYVYKKRSENLLEKISVRRRPGTVGICAAIMHRFKVDAVPHIICGGFTKEETENALIDFDFLGIHNLLVIRGDAIKTEALFHPDPHGHSYANELLEQAIHLNEGKYLHAETRGSKTDFCVGVAGYPEKHFESPNMDFDLRILKKKVDIGAHYIVTQLFFDNKKYFDFVKGCRTAGIQVPIIPGIKPITSKKQLLSIPRTFHASIPENLVTAIEKADDAHVRDIGLEWCIAQSHELLQKKVPCIHYYTMSRPEMITRVIAACF